MRWNRIDFTDCLICEEISPEEGRAIAQSVEAFIAGCKSKYPGIRRELKEGLTRFVQELRSNVPASSNLTLGAVRLLLRWCTTEGNHLQDFRRDSGRALWNVLFRGPIPDYYRYRPQTGDYVEDLAKRDRWIQMQVANPS